jgi:peroxiredoxin Q/BCP
MGLKHLAESGAAPEFRAMNEKGETVSLADLRGRNVVLYFYPKDDTPGCTKQACSLRDDYAALEALNATVLGVSPDDTKSHVKFIEKYELPFSLLVDTDKSLCEAYGVWGERTNRGRTFMGVHRSLFVIDPEGQLISVNYDISPDASVPKAMEVLQATG